MLQRFLNLFRSRLLDEDIREELDFHRSQSSGAFGNVTRIHEEAREASTYVWLETILQDVRYGLRQLGKSPLISAAAVLSLALGIGANTAIFSLINAVLIRSLPVSHPEELSLVVKPNRKRGSRGAFSHPFVKVLSGARSFSGLIVTAGPGRINLSIDGVDQRVTGETVSVDYFRVLGLTPAAGRFFVQGEDVPGAPDHAVISYGYWQRRFGLDAGVVGKTFDKDGYSYTIIGVAPQEFFGVSAGSSVDVWTTFSRTSARSLNSPGMNYLQVIGRRKAGVQPATAQAEAEALFRGHVDQFTSESTWTPREREMVRAGYIVLEPGSTGLSSLRLQYSRPLQLLLAIAALVLLIACANVANLLLARGAARAREIGMRLAIGASRTRVMRQLITESMLLASIGGVLAICFAYGGASILVTIISSARGSNPLALNLQPDWRVFVFAAGATFLVGLLFGILPAMRSIAAAVSSERSTSTQPFRARSGKLLIAIQVMLTMVLVFGAGLFLRTLVNLHGVPLGFRTESLYLTEIEFQPGTAAGVKPEVYAALLDQAPRTPGVEAAAICQPFTGGWTNDVLIPSYSTEKVEVHRYQTSAEFFRTMGITVLAGREFSSGDRAGAPRVVVVNQTLARKYFAGRDPIGQVIQFPRHDTPSQIVGVVADVRVQGVRVEIPAAAYSPTFQGLDIPIFGAHTLLVRLRGPAPDWSSRFKEIHPSLRYGGGQFASEQLRNRLWQERTLALLSSFFGGLALLLAAIGLFGNISYVMARRRTEIGVRLALGAQPRRLVSLVLREYLVLVAVGVVVGIGASLAASQLVRQFLFGVEPNDFLTIALAAGVLIGVSLATVFFPARRASLGDPMLALRSE